MDLDGNDQKFLEAIPKELPRVELRSETVGHPGDETDTIVINLVMNKI